ncbi:hypothetical protein BSL78_10424 [Apostichopus japonicus]|uniref:Reverse transcriptase domain-containing protein n=1 Tax=Stichopus japonicus TaxID=307972 RepID=A0A2G8KXP7_STIJA|nr:hypothetical protein BSL78_10424 [Apostichopus japonicus]
MITIGNEGVKQCVTPNLPVISTIVNNSLITGDVPSAFKLAHVTPLTKKLSLDPTVLLNYRPVSNFPFVAKILEKVSSRLTSYLEHNGLQETHQSAYRKHHSTETALVRIQNDVMVALGGQKACLMVLLDLSAAFDTVDHLQLLSILSDLGVKSSALKWMTSYLSDRLQIVCLGKDSSDPQTLECGVPRVRSWGLCSSRYTRLHWVSSFDRRTWTITSMQTTRVSILCSTPMTLLSLCTV